MVQSILVRMPNWLGDFVMGLPCLESLRDAFPSAKITLMSKPHLHSLISSHHRVDRLLPPNVPEGEFDLGLLLTNSFSSAWSAWKGRIARRIGFRGNYRSFLLTDPIPFPKNRPEQHLVETYLHLLSPLGITPTVKVPRLWADRALRDRVCAEHGIGTNDRILGLNPGAAYGPAKCWPLERFRAVAQRFLLDRADGKVVVLGDQHGIASGETICRGLGTRALNLAGKTTLAECIAWLARCDLVLTNDSGPMHVASALRTPLVALFGSTNPVVTGPYGFGVVLRRPVACSPCYRRECPIDFRCMLGISVDEAYAALEKFMHKDIASER